MTETKEENKLVIDKIRKLRCKSIAHFDKKQPINKTLPSFEKIDKFFINLEDFYNGLCGKIENSITYFKQDKDLKDNLEKVLQNLYVGEKNRLLGIEVECGWKDNHKKISVR